MTKNLIKIAPLLAEHVTDFELPENTYSDYLSFLQNHKKDLGKFYKYNNYLHDSWINEISITNSNFILNLNDFTTHVFSDVIVDKQNIEIQHEKLNFPVILDFKFKEIDFYIADDIGNLEKIEPTNFDEYLYEQIISIKKSEIEIGLIVWKNNFKGNRGQHIIILIKAETIEVTELQDEYWNNLFSNKFDNYYHFFKSELENGRFLSDQNLCYKLYDEIENIDT